MEIMPSYIIELNYILLPRIRAELQKTQRRVSCVFLVLGFSSFAVYYSLKTGETCPVTLKGIFLSLGSAKHNTFQLRSFPSLVDGSFPH